MARGRIGLDDIKVGCQSCSLAELCLPRGLSVEDTETLNRYIKRERTLERGEYLYHMGDTDRALFVVRSGSFKTCLSTGGGDEQVLGFYLPGELIGLEAFETSRHDCSAVALQTSAICEIPGDKVEELCSVVSGLHHQMHMLIGREIKNNHAMLLLLGKKTAQQKLATFLLSLSERFSQRGFSRIDFNFIMSRRDIGNYLGIAVETVSRILAQMQEHGLLTVDHRHVHIHDIERLRALAGDAGQAAQAQSVDSGTIDH
jgi:CRP/FNR family transcriptional regulator